MKNELLDVEKNVHYINMYFATISVEELKAEIKKVFSVRRYNHDNRQEVINWFDKWTTENVLVQQFQTRPEIVKTFMDALCPEENTSIENRQKYITSLYQHLTMQKVRKIGSRALDICEKILIPTLPIPLSPKEFWASDYISPFHTIAKCMMKTIYNVTSKESAFTEMYFNVLDTTKRIHETVNTNVETCYAIYANAYFRANPSSDELATIDRCMQWCNDNPVDAQLHMEALQQTSRPIPFFFIMWKMQLSNPLNLAASLNILDIPNLSNVLSGTCFDGISSSTDFKTNEIINAYLKNVEKINHTVCTVAKTANIPALDANDILSNMDMNL